MLTIQCNFVVGAETESRKLIYKGDESSWRFVNGHWKTNKQGDMIVPGRYMHLAFHAEHAYDDCAISGKFQLNRIPYIQLIVRSLDSRRFYAVLFSVQHDDPRPSTVDIDSPWLQPVMVSIWRGDANGYQRMVAYRRKASFWLTNEPLRWYEARVECVGPEIIVFLDDRFICAITDAQYPAGRVGVGSMWQGGVWRDLTVTGRPVELNSPWSLVEHAPVEISEDLPPLDGNVYLPSLDETWKLRWESKPGVTWVDDGENFDDLTYKNFWIGVSRSTDRGTTWSKTERLNLPFPAGHAYQPISGKAGAVIAPNGKLAELSDGSIGLTVCWRNNPDGNFQADQVLFYRSTDGGSSWSMNPVDATEWERNESTWVELANGELLCVLRSNYNTYLGISRSKNMGKTWSRVKPAIPYFGASAPALLCTRDNILVLATRGWGLFTSLDAGHTWSLPTQIGTYTGGGGAAQLRELSDGRILIGGPESPGDSQIIAIDRNGVIHPAE